MSQIILLNKPFGFLSQFSDHDGHPGLKQLCPLSQVYPAGRLDRDSEGLLLLTDDGRLQARITEPRNKMTKVYLVQVEGIPTPEQLQQLSNGVMLKDGLTASAQVKSISQPDLWPRNPPVRNRKNITDSWLQITLIEGKNRQVRRMTAAVGLPTLRLVRTQIGHWELGDLSPGQYRQETINLPRINLPRSKSIRENRK